MIGKKSKPLAGIEPTTFQIPVGPANHGAMDNSHGKQVEGFGVATGLPIFAGILD